MRVRFVLAVLAIGVAIVGCDNLTNSGGGGSNNSGTAPEITNGGFLELDGTYLTSTLYVGTAYRFVFEITDPDKDAATVHVSEECEDGSSFTDDTDLDGMDSNPQTYATNAATAEGPPTVCNMRLWVTDEEGNESETYAYAYQIVERF